MKGIVFSFKNNKYSNKPKNRVTYEDIIFFLKRYLIIILFAFLILIGLVFGSMYSQSANANFLKSLDFLFATNFSVRLKQDALNIFCSCFASNFVFLASAYIFSVAPWGIPALLTLSFFKGFGIGITAGFLFSSYSLKGIGFYLLIILPGTLLFCIALVLCSAYGFYFSKKLFLFTIIKSDCNRSLKKDWMIFSSHFVSSLIMVFISAVLDTVLWVLFAGIFNF